MLDIKQYQQMAKARGNATRTHEIYENVEIEQGHDGKQTKDEGWSEVRKTSSRRLQLDNDSYSYQNRVTANEEDTPRSR